MTRSEFLPFSPPWVGEEEINEVVATLRSDWITTGPRTKQFEEEFAAYVGAPDALAVTSCTDALQVALAALGIGDGDAVFTTTMTFCSTAHVVEHVGATPILCDIDTEHLNISVPDLEARIKTTLSKGELTPRAIIPVHHSGHPCDMKAIFELARRYGLAVVEDAAHALPAKWDGEIVGAISDQGVPRAIAFSFYVTKNMTTIEGGMLTGTEEFISEARLWSLHGMSRDAWKRYGKGGSWFYEVVRPGFKCNMTDIQAALGLNQLRRLGSFQERRREVVARYLSKLDATDVIELPSADADVEHSWHLFVIRLNLEKLTIDRSQFIDELAERNIAASVHFIPVHKHPYYRDRYSFTDEQFPVASAEYERLVSIPLHPRLSDADADDVIEAVLDVAETFKR